VADAAGQEHDINFLIDTGFAGDLSLPALVVSTFGLPFVGDVVSVLADGTRVDTPYHRAVIVWDGSPRIVHVAASDGDTPLVGTGLLAGYALHAVFVPGGEARIEKVP
jgi:clan AA aspartic protease